MMMVYIATPTQLQEAGRGVVRQDSAPFLGQVIGNLVGVFRPGPML